jgi:heat shock protein HslJ
MDRKWGRRTALCFLPALAFAFLTPGWKVQASTHGASMQDLIGTEWLLEDLAGSGVIDHARATLAFPKSGEVSGMGSCNHFFGTVEIKGDFIGISKMGSTQMQCAGSISDQERRYLSALEASDRISVEGPYLLIHSKSLEKPLRFTRLQKP